LNTKDANDYLQKSKNRIEEIGQWGLMPRWQVVNTMAWIKLCSDKKERLRRAIKQKIP
jgi:hypothetical protein